MMTTFKPKKSAILTYSSIPGETLLRYLYKPYYYQLKKRILAKVTHALPVVVRTTDFV
jgi:hypothetical protein